MLDVAAAPTHWPAVPLMVTENVAPPTGVPFVSSPTTATSPVTVAAPMNWAPRTATRGA